VDLQREAKWLLAFNFLTVAINSAAIIHYDTAWIELFTQLGWTTLLATALYLCAIPLRALFAYLRPRLFR